MAAGAWSVRLTHEYPVSWLVPDVHVIEEGLEEDEQVEVDGLLREIQYGEVIKVAFPHGRKVQAPVSRLPAVPSKPRLWQLMNRISFDRNRGCVAGESVEGKRVIGRPGFPIRRELAVLSPQISMGTVTVRLLTT